MKRDDVMCGSMCLLFRSMAVVGYDLTRVFINNIVHYNNNLVLEEKKNFSFSCLWGFFFSFQSSNKDYRLVKIVGLIQGSLVNCYYVSKKLNLPVNVLTILSDSEGYCIVLWYGAQRQYNTKIAWAYPIT